MTHADLTNKFHTAIKNLKAEAKYVVSIKTPETEEEFNSNVKWVTGTTENNTAILTTTNPHAELSWAAVKAEMDKL